ncbi:MAG: TonB-dependent receptor [Blastocatellia bacterium]|nr:TonB-dependent receptor [Blastocatellia bacterium]
MKTPPLVKLIVLVVLSLVVSPFVWGQSGSTTGSIVGRVKDSTGAAIAGAPILARQIETKIERTVEASEDGQYQFLQLPPGTYELKVQLEGFALNIQRLNLSLGTTGLVQFTLQPVGSVDVVEVKASETTNESKTENSTNIDNESIDSLPINQRNFLDFAQTAARVTPDALPGQGVTATSGLSFNGQTPRYNNVTIDGLDNNDTTSGSVRSTFSQEAVREFQVVSDGYSAEFGRALGGIVNIVTKSGTSDIHGSGFFYVRNDTLSARESLTPFKPPYNQYQFGGTVGGPIAKSKAFYFGSFERLDITQNNVVTLRQATLDSIFRLGLRATNGAVPFVIKTNNGLARVDWQTSSSNFLVFRYNYAGTENGAFEPFGGLVADTVAGVQKLRDHSGAVSNTYSSNKYNLVNETRFLFNKRDQNITPVAPDLSFVRLTGAPEGTVTLGPSTTLPQVRKTSTVQAVNITSLSRGRHLIKFGGDYVRVNSDQRQPNVELASITFASISDLSTRLGVPSIPSIPFTVLQTFDPATRTPAQTAYLQQLQAKLPATSVLRGRDLAKLSYPTTFLQGFQSLDLVNITQNFFSLFIQDDFKFRPNLLLKAGVRYDLFRTTFIPPTSGNFSPRVAFSYKPGWLQNFTIRGGYGIFFAVPITTPIYFSKPDDRVTVNLPFADGVVAFAQPGHRYPDPSKLPANLNFNPQFASRSGIDNNFKHAYSQQANLVLEYRWKNTLLTATYNFARGLRILAVRNTNPIVRPELGTIGGRLDPTRGNFLDYESAYDSYYHGLTLQANRKLSNRIGFNVNYTFSKTIDNFFDFRNPLQEFNDPLNLSAERSLSIQNVPHRFVANGTWELSYTKNPVFRDFTVSTIINLQSGRPWNLLAGVDLNRNGDQNDRPTGISRNAGIAPGFATVDFRVSRKVINRERLKVIFLAEMFNALNKTNIREFNRTIPRDAAGRFIFPPQEDGRYIVLSTNFRRAFPPRQAQFGVRVVF